MKGQWLKASQIWAEMRTFRYMKLIGPQTDSTQEDFIETDYNKTFKSQRILKAAREKLFQYKETLIKLSDI